MARAAAACAGTGSSITWLLRTPTPEISTSNTSPARMNSGGVRFMPTPLGVPVAMPSPGLRVVQRVKRTEGGRVGDEWVSALQTGEDTELSQKQKTKKA